MRNKRATRSTTVTKLSRELALGVGKVFGPRGGLVRNQDGTWAQGSREAADHVATDTVPHRNTNRPRRVASFQSGSVTVYVIEPWAMDVKDLDVYLESLRTATRKKRERDSHADATSTDGVEGAAQGRWASITFRTSLRELAILMGRQTGRKSLRPPVVEVVNC